MISTCDRQFTIPQSACAIFDGLVWGSPSLGDPTSTGVFNGANFNIETTYAVAQGFAALVSNSGAVGYEGPEIAGNLQLNVLVGVGFASGTVTIVHSVTGILLNQNVTDALGVSNYPFTIPLSAPGDTLTVSVTCVAGTGDFDPTTGSLVFTAEMSCG